MNRRSLLKCLPLAALAGISVLVDGSEAKAFEMKPDKKYLFVLPDLPKEYAQSTVTALRDRGIDATVIAGGEGLQIYEIEQSFAAKR